MYHGEVVAFDPEGILSTFPAIVNVIAGYFTGVFVQQKGKSYEGLARMLLVGSALMAVAVGWDLLLPINKKLWTSSYVLYTVGIDLIFLSFLIYIIEFRQKKAWTPFFHVFGKNPLFIYLLSELLATVLYVTPHAPYDSTYAWINGAFYQWILPGRVGSLLFALSVMMVCWLVGKFLDVKKIYIRV
jgi:predicted acyltransferase